MSTLAINNVSDVERLAAIAVKARYTSCQSNEEAAMLILLGHELGLPPMQALRGIHVVKGKPVLSSDLMVAAIRASGKCASWRVVESTPARCEIETLRAGESVPARRAWTIEDAKRAGLNSSTWTAYPAAMLRHRCAADLARQEYPDVLLGVYTQEEAESIPADVRQPAPALPAPPDVHALPEVTSQWADDLTACECLRDVRDAWGKHRATGDGGQMLRDVRAWCDARKIPAQNAEVTAIVGSLPVASLGIIDALPEADETRCVELGQEVLAAEWDEHSRRLVWTMCVRRYAALTGAASHKVAAMALEAECNKENE